MTTATHHECFRQPTIKRLGLDDGWWFFGPHFLNLGLPLVFIDACLFPAAEELGLEHFGRRRPDSPLPSIDLGIGLLGDAVGLHVADQRQGFFAAHWFRQLRLPSPTQTTSMAIVVGDSYALQLTWSALWTSHIGVTTNVHAGFD